MHLPRKFASAALAVGLGLLALAAPPAAHAEPYVWKTVTIKGGGYVTGIVFHPTVPNLIYSRTDVGGAYRWDQTTKSWIALNDDIGGLNNAFMDQGVLSLAVDPVNTQRVYLAVGQYLASWAPLAGILSSTDRGATWTRITLPFKLGGNSDGRGNGERLQVDPNQPRILYLGTNADGLWRSADNAKTWTRLTSFPEASTTFTLFEKSSSTYGKPTKTIYVGVNPAVPTAPSLYRSTDSGATWQAVPGQPAGLIPLTGSLGYQAQNVLYLAYANAIGPNGASTGAVWKLNTSTLAWTNISPPSGQGGYGGVSVGGGGGTPDVVTVSTLNRWYPGDEIFRSSDGGTTWKATRTNGNFDNSSAPWSVARSPHWTSDIEIDPFNANRALFVTGYGIWGTENFSEADANKLVRWNFLQDEFEETVPHALVSPKTGIFHLMSGLLDIGGFRHRYLRGSPPLVDYFNPYRGSTRSLAIAEENSSKLVRTVNDGTFGQITVNAGETWNYFATAPAGAVVNNAGYIALSSDGSRIVWLPNNAAASYSTNNGATWTASAGGPAAGTGSFRPVADRVNPNKFYVLQPGTGTLHVSTDGGASFHPGATTLPTTTDTPATVPGYEGNLWMPAGGNGLLRSLDSGVSFQPVASVQECQKVGFGKAAPGESHPAVFIWGKVGGIVGFYRSDNAGASWVRINDDKHNFGYQNMVIGDPRVFGRVYLATSGRGIVYGQPVGTVTDHEEVNPDDPVYDLPTEQAIYTDSFQAPWGADGWGNTGLVYTNTDPVAHGGSYAIKVPFNQSWGILRLSRSAFLVGDHQSLKLWVHGGTTGGQGISVTAVLRGDVWLSSNTYRIPTASVQANTWTEVTVPLSSLGLTSESELLRFAVGIYNYTASTGPFYLDDIKLQ